MLISTNCLQNNSCALDTISKIENRLWLCKICQADCSDIEIDLFVAIYGDAKLHRNNRNFYVIFDVNGKIQSSFGGEGAEEGKFKFPRFVSKAIHGNVFASFLFIDVSCFDLCKKVSLEHPSCVEVQGYVH